MPGAARQDDQVSGVDIHIVMIPNPSGETPVPLPHPFNGKITGGTSKDVKIDGKPAAVMGSEVSNSPSHIAMGPRFQKNPTNKGKVFLGFPTVLINGKMAARQGDMVMTCNDPVDMPICTISKGSTSVKIGG
ncbi:MAG: PAAR domain-containing protein [Dehalococcoidia bacterium]